MTEPDRTGLLTDTDLLEHLKILARTELYLRPEQIERIGLDTPIVEGLQLDSLKQIMLMANLEKAFGFEFSAQDREDVQQLETVGDLVQLVRKRVGEHSGTS
jgi:acyl carrier protein